MKREPRLFYGWVILAAALVIMGTGYAVRNIFSLGGAVSPWLAGLIHDVTGSYSLALVAMVGALLLCASLMWLISPRKLRPVPSRIALRGH